MTVTIEQTTIKNYYISVEFENRYNNPVFVVRVCPVFNENMCGYPERETIYTDRKQAHKTYLRYIREYKREV